MWRFRNWMRRLGWTVLIWRQDLIGRECFIEIKLWIRKSLGYLKWTDLVSKGLMNWWTFWLREWWWSNRRRWFCRIDNNSKSRQDTDRRIVWIFLVWERLQWFRMVNQYLETVLRIIPRSLLILKGTKSTVSTKDLIKEVRVEVRNRIRNKQLVWWQFRIIWLPTELSFQFHLGDFVSWRWDIPLIVIPVTSRWIWGAGWIPESTSRTEIPVFLHCVAKTGMTFWGDLPIPVWPALTLTSGNRAALVSLPSSANNEAQTDRAWHFEVDVSHFKYLLR